MRLVAIARGSLAAIVAIATASLSLTTSQAQPSPGGVTATGVVPAATETIAVYPPIQGPSTWDRFGHSPPSSHHRVFSNWGYLNDWSVDIYRHPGATVVSPFGSRTSAGNGVTVRVVTVVPGCATGNLADGGYRIGLEATNNANGAVVARADVMHVTNKPGGIVPGATVGPWTKLGETGRFRYSSCYQVNGDSGAHIHLEVINRHRYACYVNRGAGTELTDVTVIGQVGTQNSGPRQAC